uniref:Ovule protein n=1 Tax=Bursaphelenchus xylophilus TaxID=6326 RepID=A0A1I7S707_BURXY
MAMSSHSIPTSDLGDQALRHLEVFEKYQRKGSNGFSEASDIQNSTLDSIHGSEQDRELGASVYIDPDGSSIFSQSAGRNSNIGQSRKPTTKPDKYSPRSDENLVEQSVYEQNMGTSTYETSAERMTKSQIAPKDLNANFDSSLVRNKVGWILKRLEGALWLRIGYFGGFEGLKM